MFNMCLFFLKKKRMKAIGPRRIPEPNRKILDSTQGFRGDSGAIPKDSVWVCRDSMGFRVGRNYEFSDFWGVRNFPYYNIRSENTRNSWVRVPVSGPFILCVQGSVYAPCIYCSRFFLQNPGVCAPGWQALHTLKDSLKGREAVRSCLQPLGACDLPAILICLQHLGMRDAWIASGLPATLICLQPCCCDCWWW